VNRIQARRHRRGISLLEVLVSIFIILFGILGVAALFPVGGFYVDRANQFDRAASIGESAFNEIQIRGLLRPEFWPPAEDPSVPLLPFSGSKGVSHAVPALTWGPDSSDPLKNGQLLDGNETIRGREFLGSQQDGLATLGISQFAPMPAVAFDPFAPLLNSNGQNPWNPDFTHRVWDRAGLMQVVMRSSPVNYASVSATGPSGVVGRGDSPPTSQSPPDWWPPLLAGPNIWHQTARELFPAFGTDPANYFMVSSDDRAFDLPDDPEEAPLPLPLREHINNGQASGDLVYQYSPEGEYSWIFTAVPLRQSFEGAHLFEVSVVVFRNRDLSQEFSMDVDTRRLHMGNETKVGNSIFGSSSGLRIELTSSPSDPEFLDRIRPGMWVMLADDGSTTAGDWPIHKQPTSPTVRYTSSRDKQPDPVDGHRRREAGFLNTGFARWFRVASTENIRFSDTTQIPVRRVTLVGFSYVGKFSFGALPEYNHNTLGDGRLIMNPGLFDPDYNENTPYVTLSVFDKVVAVYQKTMRLERPSDWSVRYREIP